MNQVIDREQWLAERRRGIGSSDAAAFGSLTFIEAAGKDKHGHALWKCLCECGETSIGVAADIRRGHTKSCGCIGRQAGGKRNQTHGLSKSREYCIWGGMVNRCHNPNNSSYSQYGGRGIAVCQRWRESFEAFLSDMGPRPSQKHTVDRIDNSRGYEPDNCRWITQREQTWNLRKNIIVVFNGQSKCLAEWAHHLSMPYKPLYKRICNRGWSAQKAFSTPIRRMRRATGTMVG